MSNPIRKKKSQLLLQEKKLLPGLRKRNPDAFRQLHLRYAIGLYFLLVLLTKDGKEAEAILLITFSTANARIDEYSPDQGSLWLWLLKLAIAQVKRDRDEINADLSIILNGFQD